jgi:hypothetical protein
VNTLAIDPGTKCGWAATFEEAHSHKHGLTKEITQVPPTIFSGVWDLAPKRFEGGGMRYVRLKKYLEEILDVLEIGQVYFEEVRRHLGTDAAHIYGGIVHQIQGVCEERQIPSATASGKKKERHKK